ncbi:MAG: bifunctional glutamate N-acetyltransferase/amino-acid acetyltransferase ArgJ [Candidatus Peregrinibacteria bacterium]
MFSHLPAGFLWGASTFGLRSSASGKPDFSILFSEKPCTVAFVSTTNRFCGEPVKLCRKRFATGEKIRGVVVNVGIANVNTGEEGYQNAEEICALSAQKLGISPEELFGASTGVIGKPLPMDAIRTGIAEKFPSLSSDPKPFTEGILTTDLVAKTASKELSNGIKIFGTCKGSGMIEPNMATMLAFVVTDAAIEATELQKMWKRVVAKTFNAVSVDGDTSTSDMAFLFASGEKSLLGSPLDKGELEGVEFESGLLEVCTSLAKQIAADGEGTTKMLETRVNGAKTEEDAKKIAKSVINSNLWKCALFGNDPNWGRILCAMGYAGAEFDPQKVSLTLCETPLMTHGKVENFDANALSQKISCCKEVVLEIFLYEGDAQFTAYGCDLSYKYVEINAEYHT